MTSERELIEQKIALGWDGLRIAERLRVPLGRVAKVRQAMNDICDADLFDLFGTPTPKDDCARGHRMTLENTYRRPGGGRRECRACKSARSDARSRVAA